MSQVFWTPGMSIAEVERQIIKEAIVYFRGNKSLISKSLGISIRTLDTRMESIKAEEEAQRFRVEAQTREREIFLERSRGIPASAQYDTAATPRSFTR